jgi:hypothetical protein
VKFTYYGDTDLNGRVNFDDYVRTDNGFQQPSGRWINGDFDYSGQVNFDDYVLIDFAFNNQNGTLGRAISFLEGGDTTLNGMSDPALQKLIAALQQVWRGVCQRLSGRGARTRNRNRSGRDRRGCRSATAPTRMRCPSRVGEKAACSGLSVFQPDQSVHQPVDHKMCHQRDDEEPRQDG